MISVQEILDEIYSKLKPTLSSKLINHFASGKGRDPVWWATRSNTLVLGDTYVEDDRVKLINLVDDVSFVKVIDKEILDNYPILKNTLIVKFSNISISFVLSKNNEIFITYYSKEIEKYIKEIMNKLLTHNGLYFIKDLDIAGVIAKVQKTGKSISLDITNSVMKEPEQNNEKKRRKQ